MTDTHWRPSGAEHPRKVALAMQGSGAHGASAWGVLDRILEDDDIEVVGVAGSGVGAMNAVVLADGLLRGSREEARLALRGFWEAVGEIPGFGSPLAPFAGDAQTLLELTPQYLAWDFLSRNFAPIDLNPLSLHPLRAPLDRLVDFGRLRQARDFPVMVCATNVRSAQRRVFANDEISLEAVLASACRPHIHPAVEIDGELYWDGAFTGGPALTEFVWALPRCNLVILRTEPVTRASLPRSPREIYDRAVEIGSNAVSWMELSALAVIQRLAEEGWLDRDRFGRILMHSIDAGTALEAIPGSARLNYAPSFLAYLFDLGRAAADSWLVAHRSALGERSTLDLDGLLPISSDAFKGGGAPAAERARSYAESVHPRIKLYAP